MSNLKLKYGFLNSKIRKAESLMGDFNQNYENKAVRLTSLPKDATLNNPLKETRKRLSWEEYFSKIVLVIAERSPCERLQVGCILVKDNRIISQGYNGFLAECPHESVVRDNHEKATVHAEQNTITDCSKRGVSSDNATAYITHYPCIDCAKLLLAAGISEIKYLNDYRNDELVQKFCDQRNVTINKIE